MAKTVVNVLKLKLSDKAGIAKVNAHNMRFNPENEPNVDHSRSHMNEIVIGSDRVLDDIHDRITETGAQVRKNNAILNLIYSTHHEHFLTDGVQDQEKVKAWREATEKHIQEKFGDNLVQLVYHADETAPHYHVCVVPVNERTNQLSAREITGTRQKVAQLHTDYARAVKHLGIERGEHGIGKAAPGQALKDHYNAVNQAVEGATRDKPEATKNPFKQGQNQAVMDELHKENAHLRAEVQKSRKTVQSKSQTIKHGSRENQALKEEQKALKQEIIRFQKELDMPDLCQRLGMEYDKQKQVWKDDSCTISLRKDGGWKDFRQDVSGTDAIDLIRHAWHKNFNEAIKVIADEYGFDKAQDVLIAARIEQETNRIRREAQSEIKRLAEGPAQIKEPQRAPEPDQVRAREYLTKERKLPGGMVDQLMKSGRVYAVKNKGYTNVAFRDEGVLFMRSIDKSYKGLAAGSKPGKTGFRYRDPDAVKTPVKRVVVVESAIDALSYAAIEKEKSFEKGSNKPFESVYVASLGVGLPEYVFGRIEAENSIEIVLAMDADRAGQDAMLKHTERLTEHAIKNGCDLTITHHAPEHGKDFNEQLQSMNPILLDIVNEHYQEHETRRQEPEVTVTRKRDDDREREHDNRLELDDDDLRKLLVKSDTGINRNALDTIIKREEKQPEPEKERDRGWDRGR